MNDSSQHRVSKSLGRSEVPSIVYVGRNRLHRSRANLIQTCHTVAAFEKLGLSVRLYLPPWPRSLKAADSMRQLGVDVPLDIRRAFLLHPRWHFWPFVFKHRREMAQAGIVYTRVPEISRILCRFQIAHALEVHNVEELCDFSWFPAIRQAAHTGLLRKLIPISHAAADRLRQAGLREASLHVAPSGVNIKAFSDLPPLDNDCLERPRIVHLGRLTPERGLAVFEAVAQQPWSQVTIVGGHQVVAGAVNSELIPLVEVPSWYGQTDIVLLPYQPEIDTAATMSPLKLFEALAAGRPIVASDLPTLREVLTHESTALLVPPADIAAWLAAVNRLRHDRELAHRLAANAAELARRYSWEARARGIAKTLQLLEAEDINS